MSLKTSIRRLFAVAALAASTLATAETGVTDGSIVIGQSVPLSGPAQELGIEMHLGAKLYFDHINAQGGVNTRNPRSTVGTSTEIYDYLKLLFARIGKTYSPVSGKEVKRDTVTDVVNAINKLAAGTRIMIAAPVTLAKGKKIQDELNLLLKQRCCENTAEW